MTSKVFDKEGEAESVYIWLKYNKIWTDQQLKVFYTEQPLNFNLP